MPYFSFSLNYKQKLLNDFNIKPNQVYFSKNNYIWKILNKEKKSKTSFVNKERREKLNTIGSNVLFCLPPSIGLGDAIEYAQALQSIEKSNVLKNFGIAFTEQYSFIFKDIFKLDKIYPYIISKKELNQFDSVFHFTLEIEALKNQKNIRSNIVKEIKMFFKIDDKINILPISKFNKKIKKISIFPVSNSPIRTMPLRVLKHLINFLKKNFILEVYLDNDSEISNLLFKHIKSKDIVIINSKDPEELIKNIKNIEYGIFMDSGPLHVAKLFNKNGILIESTVSAKILLRFLAPEME